MVLVGALALGIPSAAQAQLLDDAAPYFLWANSWTGTVSGSDVIQRELNTHGAYVKMANTSKARTQVAYDTSNGLGLVESWQGDHNRAHVTYEAGVFLTAQGKSQVVSDTNGEADVQLDNYPESNGVTIDAVKKTYAIALHTCTIIHCDTIPVTNHTSVTAPGFSQAFGGSGPDHEGVGITFRGSLPKLGNGLKGHYAPPGAAVSGATETEVLDYDLRPFFEIDRWAADYRAGYLKARQGELAPFQAYPPAKCDAESHPSVPCRAATRARRILKANADVATGDFKRVVTALLQGRCPDFTRQLNLSEKRSKDIVIEGPIATYRLVRSVLRRAIVSDPHVSYDRLPAFMHCLYNYDTFLNVATLQQPGTTPIP